MGPFTGILPSTRHAEDPVIGGGHSWRGGQALASTLSVFGLNYSYERRVVPFAELHPFFAARHQCRRARALQTKRPLPTPGAALRRPHRNFKPGTGARISRLARSWVHFASGSCLAWRVRGRTTNYTPGSLCLARGYELYHRTVAVYSDHPRDGGSGGSRSAWVAHSLLDASRCLASVRE
jgi:hypothetical protein